jgi:outer membrane protein TolC
VKSYIDGEVALSGLSNGVNGAELEKGFMARKFQFVTRFLFCWLCAAAGCGFIGGCSPQHYKDDADKEVYKIIDDKWNEDFGEKVNYKIGDVPPSPNDLQVEKAVPASGVVSLAESVAIATAYNREYLTQKEALYLTALDLTLARYDFARQWFGAIDAAYTNDSEDEKISAGGELGFDQLLADGAAISTSIAIDWARFLTGDPDTSLASVLSASITQPLLRGAGRKIVQENLTQAERNALYQLRAFSRFRKSFVVSIISDYYRVLQFRDSVTNAENNYNRRVESRQRLEMEADAGRTPRFEVDQARQSELDALDSFVQLQRSYEQQLDEFKIQLSLPTDANMVLDQNELKALEKIGIVEPDYTLDAAIETALLERLDLATVQDSVNDAERKVVVAADGLGAELNLVGSAGVGSSGKTDFTRLQFHNGSYLLGLEADLPLDRKVERNAYRESLIALQQRERDYENAQDQVKLDVRQDYRLLGEAAERYRIQKNSLDLAERRVESTKMLLAAGRAQTRDLLDSQDALVQAQNRVTAALVEHAVAKLNFFLNIEVLQVKPDGMWEQLKALEPELENSQCGKPS